MKLHYLILEASFICYAATYNDGDCLRTQQEEAACISKTSLHLGDQSCSIQLHTTKLSIGMCDKRFFGQDSFVCVCSGDNCDAFEDVSVPKKGKFKRVVSSRDEHRFTVSTDDFSSSSNDLSILLTVDYDQRRQRIFGFGGAFTDSAGIAIRSLSPPAQSNLLKSYFAPEGIEYSLCRIPIAGCDFSTRPYSYDEIENDIELKHFALTQEDFLYKIPLIKEASALSNRGFRLFASPWSPPSWMKENKQLNGKGGLLKHMWNSYSDYLIRFVKEYRKHNIELWGITTVNEPLAGFQDWPWNACAWSAADMRDWLKTSFGPKLKDAQLEDLMVMIYEHGRKDALSYVSEILTDDEARKIVNGIAMHWYDDFGEGSPEVLSQLHSKFEDKFLLYTEACAGFDQPKTNKVLLGSWERAESYAENIIDDLNNYASGWVDWNLALDKEGGPNWVQNFVDSPIIVNETKDEFYKQPMFYSLGHFSKFVKPDDEVLFTKSSSTNVKMVAFLHHQEPSYIVVILNKSDKENLVSLRVSNSDYINLSLNPKSIETILFTL